MFVPPLITVPQAQVGERKLLVDSIIQRLEIEQNKRVTAVLRPPFAFGYLSLSLAPGEIEPFPRLRIILEYPLPGCNELATSGKLIVYANPTGQKYLVVCHGQQT